jgi:hypothetical protein
MRDCGDEKREMRYEGRKGMIIVMLFGHFMVYLDIEMAGCMFGV